MGTQTSFCIYRYGGRDPSNKGLPSQGSDPEMIRIRSVFEGVALRPGPPMSGVLPTEKNQSETATSFTTALSFPPAVRGSRWTRTTSISTEGPILRCNSVRRTSSSPGA